MLRFCFIPCDANEHGLCYPLIGFGVHSALKSIEYGIGNSIISQFSPYTMYLRGTIPLDRVES